MGKPQPVKAWAEKFGLSDADIAQWKAKMPAGESVLRWGLMNGRLSEPLYLKWAMENYEIPLVTSDYFAISPDPVFWNLVKDVGPWRPDFFPLAEWDGVLLIGCLEPPSDFYLRQPHRYVLASARNLLMLWTNLHPNQSEAPSPAESAPLVSADLAETHVDEVADFGSPETQDALKAAPEAEAAAAPAFEAPEGLSLNFDSDDTNEIRVESEEAAAEEEAPPEVLEGINLDITASAINLDFSALLGGAPQAAPAATAPSAPAPAAKPVVQAKAPPVPHPEPEPDQEISIHFDTPEETEEKPAFVPPPPPTPSKMAQTSATEPAKTSPSVQRELEAMRAATPTPQPRPEPPAGDNLVDFATQVASGGAKMAVTGTLETPLEAASSYDDLANQVLLRITQTFEHGVVLLFQGGQLKPWKWTEKLATGGKVSPIVLDTPSIFRIVFRTCLPYHGHVVGNPVNNRFFSEFCGGQIPAHVTITPLMMDKQIGGMLMGITNGKFDYRLSLKKMEDLSAETSKQLKRLRDAKAA